MNKAFTTCFLLFSFHLFSFGVGGGTRLESSSWKVVIQVESPNEMKIYFLKCEIIEEK